MDSKYELIDGMKIHYEIRGSGPSVILLLHSAIGSSNDFREQLSEECGLSGSEFTVVAMDSPGMGRSELSDGLRLEPTLEYFNLAAKVAACLMAKLNFRTYSVAGWSDGARIGCLIASQFQGRVNSLILWAFLPQMDKQSCWAISKTRDISTWNQLALKRYTSVYGEQKFSDLWRKYVDFCVASLELPAQLDITGDLGKIKCPTLILHGSLDPIVSYEQHVAPLESKIYNSDIMQFKHLSHNIHQADSSKFNSILGSFVSGAVGA